MAFVGEKIYSMPLNGKMYPILMFTRYLYAPRDNSTAATGLFFNRHRD